MTDTSGLNIFAPAPEPGINIFEDPVDAKVRQMYGPGMAVYLSNPELGPILRRAAQEGWDTGRLTGGLQQTDWWKRTGEAARQWELKLVENPADAELDRQRRRTHITELAGRLGVNTWAEVTNRVAEDSLRLGMSDDEIVDVLTGLATYAPGGASDHEGQIGATVTALRHAASTYFLSPPESELLEQAKRIVTGGLDLEGALGNYRQQAKANFAYLAPEIDKGVTLEDYFAETRRRIAATLETDVSSVDLMNDRRFTPILQTAGADGKPRGMTWGETSEYLLKNYGDGTRQMQQGAAEAAGLLRKTFLGSA